MKKTEQPSFDFGTDHASVEPIEGPAASGLPNVEMAEGEPIQWRHAGDGPQVPVKLGSAGSEVERRPFREAPQAVFDSWSLARQLSYCAVRDRDSARRNDDTRGFYLERAEMYKEELCAISAT